MFKTITATLALATALSLSAPVAFASPDTQLTSEISAQIRTKLTEQGYEVRKVKMEDGLFEAYVVKDGKRDEIYMNSDLEIVRRKSDD